MLLVLVFTSCFYSFQAIITTLFDWLMKHDTSVHKDVHYKNAEPNEKVCTLTWLWCLILSKTAGGTQKQYR